MDKQASYVATMHVHTLISLLTNCLISYPSAIATYWVKHDQIGQLHCTNYAVKRCIKIFFVPQIELAI